MSGYISANEQELNSKDKERYKAYYCGLCRTLSEKYGNAGKAAISYDMAVLIMLLSDLYDCRAVFSDRLCLMHPGRHKNTQTDDIAAYAADMNMILSCYRYRNDYYETHDLISLLNMKHTERILLKLEDEYQLKCANIKCALDNIKMLNERGCTDIDMQAGSFGKVLGEVCAYRCDEWQDGLYGMGYQLGRFTYILETYADIDDDIRNKRFNPLAAAYTETGFEQYICDILTEAASKTAEYFEMMPLAENADILRNVIYSGIWSRYRNISEQRKRTAV